MSRACYTWIDYEAHEEARRRDLLVFLAFFEFFVIFVVVLIKKKIEIGCQNTLFMLMVEYIFKKTEVRKRDGTQN